MNSKVCYLAVVSRESNRQNIAVVTDEAAGACSRVDVPKTKSAIPGAGEGELAIRGDDNVGDEVRMTTESTLGVSVLAFFASQLPDDDSLVFEK